MTKLYVGTVGVTVIVTTGITLTGATTVELLVQKPDGTDVVWTSAIDDTNAQRIKYVIASGDLDIAGAYLVQAKVYLGSEILIGETYKLVVYDLYR